MKLRAQEESIYETPHISYRLSCQNVRDSLICIKKILILKMLFVVRRSIADYPSLICRIGEGMRFVVDGLTNHCSF